MNQDKIIIIVGITFIPLGLLMSIFSKQFAKAFCKIARWTWKDIPPSMQKSQIVKEISESAKETYEHPTKTSRLFKYIMGPATAISGIVIILVAVLLSKYG